MSQTDVACGGTDCDDGEHRRYAGNGEVCDGEDLDEDCRDDTFGDLDADGDGYVSDACCNGATCGDDCDDSSRGANPNAPEVCDREDNDCDGAIDEGLLATFWFDFDNDHYGDPQMTAQACARPSGFALEPGDCDDRNERRHPTRRELCDGIDDDCDLEVDERAAGDIQCVCNPTATLNEPCGPPSVGECRPGSRVCIDGAWSECIGALNPRPEQCNARDDDCDGSTDERLHVGDGTASWAEAQAIDPQCRLDSGAPCEFAFHQLCRRQAAPSGFCSYTTGFGIVDQSQSWMTFMCIDVPLQPARWSEFRATGVDCTYSTRASLSCRASADRWCRMRNFESGFGPLYGDPNDDRTAVACLTSDQAQQFVVSYRSDLARVTPSCSWYGSDPRACENAVMRLCRERGFEAGGFGPVGWLGDSATISCVRDF